MESVNRRKQVSTPRILSQFSDRVETTRSQPGQSSTNPTSELRKLGKKALKKRDNLDDEYTVLTIDQTQQILSTLIYAWFPEGERP
jgi:hypothetical protein